ncbi:CRISPR-associated protein Cas4 [Acetomicrobium sp.]|uniref:CRISPR-associated protein Cas4 n=1 Tax=Acetomicrobium sp. TaxID=1872099 RepID=UPI001BCF6B94|nr:CRISPR-associated protein Cas4 [Acetomicrobium sp.]
MCLVNNSSKITGTLIWYYYICHREVWLMAHEINPEADNVLLDLGRLIHEESYPRNKKEFSAPGMKIDIIKERDGELIVGEIKKSSRFIDSAKMQLIYYLYRLRQMGIEAKGELLIPKERKRISVELTSELQCMLETTMQGIREITALSAPPPPMRIPFCRSCAYAEFCWG